MVPLERYAPGTSLFKSANVYDAEIGASYVPKNADDLKRIMQQLNRPSEGRYATAAYTSSGTARALPIAFQIQWYSSLFGAPRVAAQSSGQLSGAAAVPSARRR
jgi:hypothetical protein